MYLIKKVVYLLLIGIFFISAMGVSTAAAAKKTKSIVWSNPWVPAADYLRAWKGFEKVNPNVTVEVVTQIDRAKLLFAIATGTAPDIITLVTPIAELSDRGLLTPLNSYLQSSKVIKRSDYHSSIIDIYSSKGKLCALPSISVGAWLSLIYNKTVFQEAGLDPNNPARTLDDLTIAHKKLTRFQGDVLQRLGLNPAGSMGGIYFPETWGQVFNAKCVDTKAGRIIFDSPEMTKAVSYVDSFYRICNPQQLTNWWNKAGDWGASIANGSLAMEINGDWTAGQVTAMNPKAKIGTYWVPNVLGDRMMAYGGWSLAIPKCSKHPDLAWKLIEYMTTKTPSQVLFDKLGFLNGNRRIQKELDLSSHPEIKWYLNAMEIADRITTTPDVPMWDKCVREILWQGIDQVCFTRKMTPAAMLKQVQKQCDMELDKYYKKIKR